MEAAQKRIKVGSNVLLELRDFSVAIAGRALFTGLNLAVDSGEMICLAAPSGSGKSTFLRAIALLIDPDTGRCLLNGKSPEDIGIPRYRRSVVYVDQIPVFLPGTVEYNLQRSFGYNSAKSAFPRELALSLIERALLPKSIMENRADTLSIGEQQRVALVRAMLLSPAVYLFDEPTSSLDGESAGAVEALIANEVKSKNSVALIVTHNNEQADRFCAHKLDLTQYTAADSSLRTERQGA